MECVCHDVRITDFQNNAQGAEVGRFTGTLTVEGDMMRVTSIVGTAKFHNKRDIKRIPLTGLFVDLMVDKQRVWCLYHDTKQED